MNLPVRAARLLSCGWAAILLSALFLNAASAADDPHSQHQRALSNSSIKRSLVEVDLRPIALVRQDGVPVTLVSELADKKPVVLAFIYTSCTTVCPVTSQILARTQALLGKEKDKVHLVSISIDPEYDTPERLLEYSKRFDAKPQWQHYTGTLANSIAVQKAFKAYRGDKMNHAAVMFVNGGGMKSWVRLDGFPTAEDLLRELREQING